MKEEWKKRTINRYEELAINAFPALLTELYDGWVLRYSNGYTYRGNCINPIYDSSIDLEKKVAECEERFEKKGLPVVYKVTDATDDRLLELLKGRGYQVKKSADIMVKSLEAMPKEEGVDLSFLLTDEWLEEFVVLNGTSEEPDKSTVKEMLNKIGNPLICASIQADGKMAGCALGVLENGEVGLFDVRIKEEYRKRGLATKICNAILERASLFGAKQAYLQVMDGNEKAIGLYKRLGFVKEYSYSYLVKEKHGNTTLI